MEPEIRRRIEEKVREILSGSDMDEMTESKVRKLASDELDLNLSKPPYKAVVKQVVESFLEEQSHPNEDQQEEEPRGKEYDKDGNLVICKLSEKRMVTVQEFRGKTLVSIRDYYKKDGKEFPTSKGISLTEEQWSTFVKNVAAIEKAIGKMQEQVR